MSPDRVVNGPRPEVVARTAGVLGEVVLRHWPAPGRPVHELIVNGVFLMDTADGSTERLLAGTLLARHPDPRRVLVAGLGLGCTLAALLADSRPRRVDVVEIEPELVAWCRAGLVPEAGRALADPRVRVWVADIQQVLAASPPNRYDALVLDVDNGPGFLVHDRNAAVYRCPALAAAARAVRPGGLVLVWSSAPAPELRDNLATAVGTTEHVVRWVERAGRRLDYHIYLTTVREAPCT
jgi:spermidine synthase